MPPLLQCGVEPDGEDAHGDTALSIAIRNGQIDVISLLLRTGASPYQKDWNGYTPLAVAAVYGRHKVVEYLIEELFNRDTEKDDTMALQLFGSIVKLLQSHVRRISGVTRSGT